MFTIKLLTGVHARCALHLSRLPLFSGFVPITQHLQPGVFLLRTKTTMSAAPEHDRSFIAESGAEKVTWKRSDGTEVPGYAFGKGTKPSTAHYNSCRNS